MGGSMPKTSPKTPSESASPQPAKHAQNGTQPRTNGAAKPEVSEKNAATPPVPTIAHTLGEMVWLMSRSPLHRHLKIADLEWLLMPAILLQQFRLFRSGEQVVGLALWAYLTPAQADEMGKDGKLPPDQWRFGTDVKQYIADQQAGKNPTLPEPELIEGEVELWLVDFIVPFATKDNKLAEICMNDLIQGPLKGKTLKMHKTNPQAKERTTVEVGGNDVSK